MLRAMESKVHYRKALSCDSLSWCATMAELTLLSAVINALSLVVCSGVKHYLCESKSILILLKHENSSIVVAMCSIKFWLRVAVRTGSQVAEWRNFIVLLALLKG